MIIIKSEGVYYFYFENRQEDSAIRWKTAMSLNSHCISLFWGGCEFKKAKGVLWKFPTGSAAFDLCVTSLIGEVQLP